MAHIVVALENAAGLRISVATVTSIRSVADENAVRAAVETAVNADPIRSRHGPWTVVSSGYTSA